MMREANLIPFKYWRKHIHPLVVIFAIVIAFFLPFVGNYGRQAPWLGGISPSSSAISMLFRYPMRSVVTPELVLFPDDITGIFESDDRPDTDIVLVEPTAHLKSRFYVGDPGRPYGIVEYITIRHDGERAVTEVTHHVLRAGSCGSRDNAVVLDIGANTGFYSMLALADGCQWVLLFEPQPACIRNIAHALVRNGFQDRAGIVPHFVDIRSGRSVELELDPSCQGRWPIGQLENDNYQPDAGAMKVMSTVGISDIVPPGTRIAHTKVDTEGAEYFVLLSLLPYIATGMVDSVIFEITPMWWVHHGLNDRGIVIDQFVTLVTRYGMHCRALLSTPWYTNEFFTKDNASVLAARINETYQTDFWFFKPGLDRHSDEASDH